MILIILLLAVCSIPASSQNNTDNGNYYMRGISLGMHSKHYNYDYTPLIEEISDTGADWIGLTIKFRQDKVNSDSIIIPSPSSAFWDQLIHTIRSCRASDLKVFLSPIIKINHPEGDDWRGSINPDNKEKWCAQYTDLIKTLAILCEKENVSMLSIGSELTSMQGHEHLWRNLITDIKNIYTGILTYSSNWDALNDRSFFNELDMLGISAYFKLSDYTNPSQRTLNKSWMKIRKQINEQMEDAGIDYFFSELGYRSINGANKSPWNHQESNKGVDLEEQYDCYAAFTHCWKNDDHHKGVFFYDWFGNGGFKDKSYTPRGKPALELIKDFFAFKANAQVMEY